MKVFSVSGLHHTGKTTTVIQLMNELRRRGYTVQSIKDIHSDKFTMEKVESNSWKHWKASNNIVIARGLNETYQIWHKKLTLNEMLKHLDADYVIVEGMKKAAIPKIFCAKSKSQLDEYVDDTVFSISGVYANDNNKYRNLPVLDSTKDIIQLTDLVERKVFEVLPLAKPECCSECGFSCYAMVGKILTEEKSRDDCKTDRNLEVEVRFNHELINIVPYVQSTIKDVIKALTKNLKGYSKGDRIDITINELE